MIQQLTGKRPSGREFLSLFDLGLCVARLRAAELLEVRRPAVESMQAAARRGLTIAARERRGSSIGRKTAVDA